MRDTLEPHLRVRRVASGDAPALCSLLNAIIEIGGTTALEVPLTQQAFGDQFLDGARVLFCLVAQDCVTMQQVGFQCVVSNPALPEGWGDIATFAQPVPKISGVGTALFRKTAFAARDAGLAVINAEIRADNRGGLVIAGRGGEEWVPNALSHVGWNANPCTQAVAPELRVQYLGTRFSRNADSASKCAGTELEVSAAYY